MVKLSILICHLPDKTRTPLLNNLLVNLNAQIEGIEELVEILVDAGDGTIGAKRNRLLQAARGEYVAFIDDDDSVALNYVFLLLEGIESGADCCSLRGVIYEKNAPPRIFEHSIQYRRYETVPFEGDVKYLRHPNHLNCIKADIAKRFQFPEINHGEDTDWATQILHSGLLKTEHWIEQDIYQYIPSYERSKQ